MFFVIIYSINLIPAYYFKIYNVGKKLGLTQFIPGDYYRDLAIVMKQKVEISKYQVTLTFF